MGKSQPVASSSLCSEAGTYSVGNGGTRVNAEGKCDELREVEVKQE